MIILLGFSFLSGLVTILAPCIWPLLPIILSSSSTGGRKKPLGITLGIIVSFAFFTLALSYLVKIFHLDSNVLRAAAVFVIGFLGFSLVIPALSARLEILVSRFSGIAGGKTAGQGTGFSGGFLTGFSLGLVWSPCAGPILATIAALAATQAVSFQVVLVTVVYVIGVGIPLFLFATGGSWLFTRSRLLSRYTGRIQQVFGVVMILTAAAIYTNYDKVLEVKLLNAFPAFSSSLTSLEHSKPVKQQLEALKGINNEIKKEGIALTVASSRPSEKTAPEFVGITRWLNTPTPLSLAQLRGKVVLVDFWTYTCINCIRTLPHVTSWYDNYKDKGFVVIGIHTPEFEFEKDTSNVLNAVRQYHIHYPVAQDNDYKTWQAYNNEYWPAEYLIDAQGKVRHTNFGEGGYEETETAIRELLAEQGANLAGKSLSRIADQTPQWRLTPETYLGFSRMARFSSKEMVNGGSQVFMLPGKLPLHHFAYQGTWNVMPESAVAQKGSVLEFHFLASKVFLVITPKASGDRIKVFLDGKPIQASEAGSDVKQGEVVLSVSRLYHLVNLKGGVQEQRLRLEFENSGISVFAFTFG